MSLDGKVFLAVGNVSLDQTKAGNVPGGPVLYSTLAAKKLGWSPIAITSFGPDFYQVQPPLDGIELRVQQASTTLTLRLSYDTSGNREITVVTAGDKLRLETLDLASKPDVLFLCPTLNDYTEEQALELIKRYSSSYVAVAPQGWMRSVDKNGVIKPKVWEAGSKLLPYVDLMVVSVHDISGFDGLVHSYIKVIGKKRSLDGIIVLTQGSQPNQVFAGLHQIIMNTIPTQEVDPTGAGDVFAAMFAMAYREKGPGAKAITHALSWAQIGGSYLASQGMKGLVA